MADYDWTRFTLRINVSASPEALYKAWATRRGIESWFLRLSEYSRNNVLLEANEPVRQGDSYKWQWFGYPDSVVEYGEVLQANGKDFFEFTFGGTAELPMHVSVTFRIEEGETIVELTQYNIAVDDRSKSNFHVGCMQGWTFYLANLKSLMEAGIDLRNKNEKLQRMMNSGCLLYYDGHNIYTNLFINGYQLPAAIRLMMYNIPFGIDSLAFMCMELPPAECDCAV